MDSKNYFVHESSYVDEPCQIGKGTKIWHFSHVMKNSIIGENCNIGQNVVVSSDVQLGNNVKIQNNVFSIPQTLIKNEIASRRRVSRDSGGRC